MKTDSQKHDDRWWRTTDDDAMTGDDEATTDNEYQQTMMRTTGEDDERRETRSSQALLGGRDRKKTNTKRPWWLTTDRTEEPKPQWGTIGVPRPHSCCWNYTPTSSLLQQWSWDKHYTEDEEFQGPAVGLLPSNLQLPPAAVVLMIGQRIDDKNKATTEGQHTLLERQRV